MQDYSDRRRFITKGAAAAAALTGVALASQKVRAQALSSPPSSFIFTAINVKSPPYNAAGDGTTDDTAAIQAAMNAANSMTAGTGAVYFPSGKYLISAQSTNRGYALLWGGGNNPLTIFGDGFSSEIFMTSSIVTAPTPTNMFSVYAQLNAFDLYLNGNTTTRSPLETTLGACCFGFFAGGSGGASNSSVMNCYLSPPGSQTIATAGGSNVQPVNNITIANNIVIAGYDTGIDIDGTSNNIVVDNNTIYGLQNGNSAPYNYSKFAIAVDYNSPNIADNYCSITNNTIYLYYPATGNPITYDYATPIGILLQKCANNNISNNTIYSNGSTGIFVTSTAAGNIIDNNTMMMISASGNGDLGFGIRIEGNELAPSDTSGDKYTNIVSNNTIQCLYGSSAASGILVERTGATLIGNNIKGYSGVSGQGGIGIWIKNTGNLSTPSTAYTIDLLGNNVDNSCTSFLFSAMAGSGTSNGGVITINMAGNHDLNASYTSMQIGTGSGSGGSPTITPAKWPGAGSVIPGQMVLNGYNPITTGTVTLNGASNVTVSNAAVSPNSQIEFTLKTVGGTVGAYPSVKTITPGTGFAVAGTASDTSVYNYQIVG